jgi:hypothetical protein
MTNANDNALAQTRNAAHSIALAAIGDEHVVSCFPLVDGEPDTSREVFVRVFADAAVARRVYTAQAALLKCRAGEFDRAVDWVYAAVSSLGSCLHREVRNEAYGLSQAVQSLTIAGLARRDASREARKAQALTRAAEALARRLDGLDAKIAAEAASRAEKGQP